MFRYLFHNPVMHCLLCHENSGAVCENCMADLVTGMNHCAEVCPKCAAPSVGGVICGVCQRDLPAFDQLWASIRYEMPITGVLHEWKHLRRSAYVFLFAQIMYRNPPPWLHQGDDVFFLAMPISRERRLFRGFNQIDDLVEQLSQYFSIPVLPNDTVQRLHRPPQSTLGATERRKNVHKIFQIRQKVENCKIVLIDDVVTTGATVSELAQSLKKAGATQVNVWAVASNKMQKI